MYTLFAFSSKCNPFVAMTPAAAKETKRHFTRKNVYIEKLGKNIYLVHDADQMPRLTHDADGMPLF